MTLVLIDGCEDLSSVSATAAAIAAGRTGNGIQLSISGNVSFSIPAAQQSDTIVVGFAHFQSSYGSASAFICDLNSDAGSTRHLRLIADTDGSVKVRRGVTDIIATAAGVIALSTWQYIEVSAKLADSGGTCVVRVNGTQVGTFSGDTKNAGTKTVFDFVQWSSSASTTMTNDDVYIKTGTGETFLGDITVETLYPDGNGAASAWTGSDGDSTNNYLLVSEAGAPVTTDYVKSSTVGQVDEYTLSNLIRSGTIVGVCHQATMALAAAGSQTFAIVNRRTVDTVGATQTATSTTYAGFHEAYANDPETSAAWTVANVNALQTGVKVI